VPNGIASFLKESATVNKTVTIEVHQGMKKTFRLVCRLDGTIPFHRKILYNKDAAAKLKN